MMGLFVAKKSVSLKFKTPLVICVTFKESISFFLNLIVIVSEISLLLTLKINESLSIVVCHRFIVSLSF